MTKADLKDVTAALTAALTAITQHMTQQMIQHMATFTAALTAQINNTNNGNRRRDRRGKPHRFPRDNNNNRSAISLPSQSLHSPSVSHPYYKVQYSTSKTTETPHPQPATSNLINPYPNISPTANPISLPQPLPKPISNSCPSARPMYATSSESDSQISFAPSSIVDMEDEAKMLVDDLVPSAQKPREVDVTKDENFGHMKSSEFLTFKSSTPLPTGVQSIIPYNSKAPNVILEKLERLELLKDSDGAHEIFVEGDDEKIVRSCSNGVVRLVGLHIEAFYLEENLWSSSLEEEENVKTSEALGCDAFMRTSDSSTQIWVFDPGILNVVHEFRTEASFVFFCYVRTRGRVLHKKRSLMQEQINYEFIIFSIFKYI